MNNDLDIFFEKVYIYYKEGGRTCIIVKQVVNTLVLGFMVCFTTILIGFLNWTALINNQPGPYIVGFSSYQSTLYLIFVLIYMGLLFIYFILSFHSSLEMILTAFEMYDLYQTVGCKAEMEWHQIVEKLMDYDRNKEPIQLNNSTFTAKEIAMRIMRKKNYWIALVDENVLGNWYIGNYAQTILEIVLFFDVFDHQFQLRMIQPRDLQKRLHLMAILSFILIPFSFVFMIFFLLFKYGNEWHSKHNYLGPRWWSPPFMTEQQDYNELPHLLERRLQVGVKHANTYVEALPYPIQSMIASGVSFIAGAFVTVVLLLTLLDDAVLLEIHVYGRNILWYFTVFSGILTISRSMISTNEYEDTAQMEQSLRSVVMYTHWFPLSKHELFYNFPYKLTTLFKEIGTIFTTPYILMYVIRPQVVVDFINDRTLYVHGVGDVCVYSTLEITMDTHNRKLLKSWLNFRLNYPNWDEGSYKLDQVIKSQAGDIGNKHEYFYWFELL